MQSRFSGLVGLSNGNFKWIAILYQNSSIGLTIPTVNNIIRAAAQRPNR
jgi:hypothetical protein